MNLDIIIEEVRRREPDKRPWAERFPALAALDLPVMPGPPPRRADLSGYARIPTEGEARLDALIADLERRS